MKSLFTRKRLAFPLAALLALVLLLGTLPITGPAVLTRISALLGLELQIARLGGNLVNHLTVGSIKGVRRDRSQQVAEFAAADLRLDYSLASLLGGVDAFLARLRIEAGQVRVVLELSDEQNSRSAPAESGGEIMLPPVLPAVDAENIELVIRGPDYEATIVDATLRVAPAKGSSGQSARLDLPALQLLVAGRKKLASSGQATLLYSAGQLRIEELTLPDQRASLQGVLVLGEAGQPLSFTLQAAISGGQLQGSGTVAAEQTSLAMQVENIDLAELAALFQFEDVAVGGRLSGRVTTQFVPDDAARLAADVDLRLVQGSLFGKKSQARLAATMKDGLVKVREFAAEHGENQAELAEGTAPLALFTDWSVARLAGVKASAIKLHLRDLPAFLALFGVEVALPAVPGHVLEARGSMADRMLAIERADFTTAQNSAVLRAALLQFPAAGQSFLASTAGGSLQLDLRDLQEISSLFALPPMAGKVRGQADISGSLGSPAGVVSLAGEELVYDGCPLGEATVEGRADSKELLVSSLFLRNGADTLEAAGSYDFATGRFAGISGTARLEDVGRYSGSCLALEEETAGRLEAAVTGTEDGRQRLELTLSEAAYAGLHDAELRVVVNTDWRSYDITEAELASAGARLRLAGQIVPQPKEELVRAELTRLSAAYGGAAFVLQEPVLLALAYGAKGTGLEVGETLLTSGAAEISLQGFLAWQEESSFRIEARKLTSREWLDGLLGQEYRFSGGDLRLTLHGPLAAPRAALSARIDAIHCPQLSVPMSGDMDLAYSSGAGLTIHKFVLATSHGQQITLAGQLPYDPLADNPFLTATLDLRGKVVLPDLQGLAENTAVNALQEGGFFSDFQLAGSWEEPTGELNLRGSNLSLHRFFKHAPAAPLSASGQIRFLPGELRLQQLTVQGQPLSFNVSGTWSDIPSLAGLIRQPPEGLPGALAFDGKLDLPEVGWLAAYAGGLRRLSGHAAATAHIRGPAARPEFSGAATLTRGSVRLADPNLPAIEQLELTAGFDRAAVTLEKLTGVFGGSPLQAEGRVAMTGPDAPLVDCRLQGKNLLFYRDESMKIRADADLTAKGPLRKLQLAGKVVIVDGRYTKNVDFLTMFRGSNRPKSDLGMQLFSFGEPPWRDMVFDVRITADKPFVLFNNMARGEVRPNLQLSGTGEIPVLTGRIFVDPTRISVPAGKIVIESGVITFPENDPDQPTFNLNAESRLAGYDITLIFQGTPEEPVVTLSSDPPLAEEELLLLVLTGQPPQSSEDKPNRAMANMNTAVYLGKGLLSKWFGSEFTESEESVLDRFQLDFGRQLSKSGDETVEAQFRMMEGVFLPGDRLYLTSEKDIYDNFNVGLKVVFRFK
ncbi:MAG: translocation/assembly module TamB domain-containing protein [Thermodesulfobacteriota bacterium]